VTSPPPPERSVDNLETPPSGEDAGCAFVLVSPGVVQASLGDLKDVGSSGAVASFAALTWACIQAAEALAETAVGENLVEISLEGFDLELRCLPLKEKRFLVQVSRSDRRLGLGEGSSTRWGGRWMEEADQTIERVLRDGGGSV